MASVSLRKAFGINRNPLCQVLPLLQTFTPVKLPVAWQFGAKYYLLTRKIALSSPFIVTYVTQPVSKGHGSGNRIKVYC
ncbi:hypothetical protein CXP54_16280 [Escherichia albertii]|uniref:Uncharacterized protein n=1 Tax=Escherichia albertii TaxID=208962 RepID=A0ABX5HGI6_ESCAL|nr:hypothetical protein EAKF1_ch2875 [Escherichia albertii KF1]AUS68505.1 hypothetical protein CXP54_16280 [Escherichia albertii]EAB1452019.1 hypothetical protein [Escherichia albertii]EEW3327266.1 hypothetical protein [Escherichia albertii]EEW4356577.1 hypothetical protein [Escherichia albertii]